MAVSDYLAGVPVVDAQVRLSKSRRVLSHPFLVSFLFYILLDSSSYLPHPITRPTRWSNDRAKSSIASDIL